MKDVKPIFLRASAQSETMIVERILVKVLPELLRHGQTLSAETIEQADHILVPEDLYLHILSVAETLTGQPLVEH